MIRFAEDPTRTETVGSDSVPGSIRGRWEEGTQTLRD